MAIWWIPCSVRNEIWTLPSVFSSKPSRQLAKLKTRVITDGHRSYPRAIREILGKDVLHQCNHYLNNQLEQDHRGVKQRYYPMRGFGSFPSASRFCRAFDEVRQFFRIRTTMKQPVSLQQQREMFLQRLVALQALVQAV
jgi:transposase-like protein